MRLEFTSEAIADLDHIYDHIALNRPASAIWVAGRIRATALLLCEFPLMGRAGTVLGTRELVVRGLPYILIYRVDEAAGDLLILNVLHGAQSRPDP